MTDGQGRLLWTPPKAYAAQTNIEKFFRFLRDRHGLNFGEYSELHRFSVTEAEKFWELVWQYFNVQSDSPYACVLSDRRMPGARWFEGAKVNYAEHILRAGTFGEMSRPAIIGFSEVRPESRLDWRTLGAQVRRLATSLRQLGISKGDRIVAYMPNIPETVVAMLASISIGAIWASAAPEFGTSAVLDRFRQIEPKLMFAIDGYRFGATNFDRTKAVSDITKGLPSLTHVVWLPYLDSAAQCPAGAVEYNKLLEGPEVAEQDFRFERMACDDPLWILFSSGTTGLPKAIVHSHVGMLLTHFVITFHTNLSANSRVFFYTTTGWMVFNALVGGMLSGAAIVTYDGSPVHPTQTALFSVVQQTRATAFAASPAFVLGLRKNGVKPNALHDLSSLQSMVVTGSPVAPEVFEWVYTSVKEDIWMCSPCGGTELCSTMVSGVPTLPVRAGVIQAPTLGIDVGAYDSGGNRLVGEIGELIIASPAPCMPIYFWNDPGNKRYFESYFNLYPGVWRHGDFIRFEPDGSSVVYGRSDATMNRHGVRIGTSEIYRCVEALPQIADSIAVCVPDSRGTDRMHLFLQLRAGVSWGADLQSTIKAELRSKCSPRHVPDHLHAVRAIPYTLTGKKMEIPVRKVLQGMPVEAVASRESMKDTEALDDFARLSERMTS